MIRESAEAGNLLTPWEAMTLECLSQVFVLVSLRLRAPGENRRLKDGRGEGVQQNAVF